ncbi:LuxR C-terminal-related transcriptional regulator [Actinoplanes sp. NBRC 101535]|uniref:LuxR C-terminal-related transcriptional regulator n=1 Tax=Actinoplanes sp. NBRC 101535 TaxID=3032196 RepID=UPI0024A596EC|nr:LuxR C-terminal-related transcriptional regulator [Actinoplanes sp. NBRC 101535]GLY06625.1 hypothetical protein Acsp01_70040 [Actinoplanes sp. NBRC 101535]
MPAEPTTASTAARDLLGEHAQTVAEQATRHALTLESILAVLRSSRLDATAARTEAIEVASAALIGLRTATDQQRSSLLEPVTHAFTRLRDDLRPLVRFGELDVQFIEPPASGRALPGDVARAARTIVRTAVLALIDAGTARRVRIQWDCDGRNLLVEVRDDGDGMLDAHDDAIRPIAERVAALDGHLRVSSTPTWGSQIDITIPLDAPAFSGTIDDQQDLTERERDVLRLVVTGAANQEIAHTLNISINTAKYHVANLLRKFGARSRAELAALSR